MSHNKNLIESDIIKIENPREVFKDIVDDLRNKNREKIKEAPMVEKNSFLKLIGRIRKDCHNDNKMEDSQTLKVK